MTVNSLMCTLSYIDCSDITLLTGDGKQLDVYGVIQSVDHAGRTCQITWMKPSGCSSK